MSLKEDIKSGTALITGASAGLGEEYARQLHHKGYRVILVARRGDKLTQLVSELDQKRAGSALAFAADLTDAHERERVLSLFGTEPVDLLVNNAGFGSFGQFDLLDIEREVKMIELNVIATTILAHAAFKHMRERKRGAVIILSSIAGLQPLPFMSTYAATKAFNLWQALALHEEYRRDGIRVMAVCPGPVATEFRVASKIERALTGYKNTPEQVVRESLAALDSGKSWMVPCLYAKLVSFPSRILPRCIPTWIIGRGLGRAARGPSTP